MTIGEVWTLVRGGGEVVGEIYVDDHDFPCYFGRFTALPGFETLRPLFDEESRLSERLEDDDSDATYAAWEALYLRIRSELDLVHPSGRPVAEYLLHIEDDQAGFRWHDMPFPDEA